jgi:serine/threonine protein kinase
MGRYTPWSITPWKLKPHLTIDHPLIMSVNNSLIAKKMIPLSWVGLPEFEHEVDMHTKFKMALPNNIPGFVGMFESGDGSWVYIQEEIHGDTLSNYVKKSGVTMDIISQMKDIFLILDGYSLTHGDTHGDNFIVDNTGKVWLIDFGLSTSSGVIRDTHVEINVRPDLKKYITLDIKSGKITTGCNSNVAHPRLCHYLRHRKINKIKTYAHYNNISY